MSAAVGPTQTNKGTDWSSRFFFWGGGTPYVKKTTYSLRNDNFVSKGLQTASTKIGQIFTLYHRELIINRQILWTFFTQPVIHGLSLLSYPALFESIHRHLLSLDNISSFYYRFGLVHTDYKPIKFTYTNFAVVCCYWRARTRTGAVYRRIAHTSCTHALPEQFFFATGTTNDYVPTKSVRSPSPAVPKLCSASPKESATNSKCIRGYIKVMVMVKFIF